MFQRHLVVPVLAIIVVLVFSFGSVMVIQAVVPNVPLRAARGVTPTPAQSHEIIKDPVPSADSRQCELPVWSSEDDLSIDPSYWTALQGGLNTFRMYNGNVKIQLWNYPDKLSIFLEYKGSYPLQIDGGTFPEGDLISRTLVTPDRKTDIGPFFLYKPVGGCPIHINLQYGNQLKPHQEGPIAPPPPPNGENG